MPAKKRIRSRVRTRRAKVPAPAAFHVGGKRLKITKWIHGRRCVVSVEVEVVLPTGDPSELCLEPATVRWLDELQALADAGDLDALGRVGEVYVRRRSA